MSGIAGIIHFDGKPIEPGLIEKMTGAMAHRGPDGIHHWVKGSVALGQCMFRTTPESLEEHQPLTNEDESLVLVMDGRVDNWEELRRELLGRGAVLRTRADAELVLRAYELWGRDYLAHIDGDFALVIWDTRRREAFCARDRMGAKPFNYYWDGKTFVFASELHTMLALPWVPEILNEGMLAEFLAAEWYSRDETFWQGVLRLVAAHTMVVDRFGLRLEKYWAPNLWVSLPYTKDEEYIEHYRELFSDVVRRKSRSHRPVAYEVSGGLDSSGIFCMAEHLRRSSRLPAPGIRGYTLAFKNDLEANELAYSQSVGEYLGIQIKEILPTKMPLPWYSERHLKYRDFPGFPNGVMFCNLMRHASLAGSRVLLGGRGGDEWLGGSRAYYAEELVHRRWAKLYGCYQRDTEIFGASKVTSWLLRHGVAPLLPERSRMVFRWLTQKIDEIWSRDVYWLSAEMRELIRIRRCQYRHSLNKDVCGVVQNRFIRTLNSALGAWGIEDDDRLGAACGIEKRYPFNSISIAQLAFSTPERLRLNGDVDKYVHVRALSDLMPLSVLERKSHATFSILLRPYMRRLESDLTCKCSERHADWVSRAGVTRLCRACREDPQNTWPRWILWCIHGCEGFVTK